ncbi:L,D-transpeptidase family protein [Chelatococcus sp. SYSU_G07232]|uniref:L,D-transpeptidase family protein n=1 Tax=Chelatococcus albus TaxID=3047466 RepID=A0ABT7AEW4_9HYPH|nr:L,D-transpeptidase family protein [Chelatococcus sp. SYSU_G07232]MDJ1157923.1 L,D-transpeptidase family protein [Chelatococcus sp. SYSU_G07232]
MAASAGGSAGGIAQGAVPAGAAATVRETTLITQDPQPTFSPHTAALTAAAAEKYLAIVEAGGWPLVPAGTRLAPGASGPAVEVLKRRLAVTGDLPPDVLAGDAYDGAVEAAVKHFQMRHGLEQTGAVGPLTLQALNVAAIVRYGELNASAVRAANTAFGFGQRHVVVNIPGAAVEAIEGGRVSRRYLAVVGKPDRPSPTLETRITAVNLNPTWTVPSSIVRKDIIPKMQGDPAYLAKAKIRILDQDGREIDPAAIDWSTTQAAAFTLRQDAGAQNSLGSLRIDMPNSRSVYMHDTPSKGLFSASLRFASSGCVRVSDVRDFATWLLAGNGPEDMQAWDRSAIDAAIAIGKRLDVRLAKPVPVAWVYLTAYATPDGLVHFRPDVYDLDSGAELTASVSPASTVLPPRRPNAADLAPLPPARQVERAASTATVAVR